LQPYIINKQVLKKLDKFLIKSYLGPFILTFFISLFVLLMQFLWKYIDDFVGKGFDTLVIAELMLYASATFVPLALPLAVLLSSLMNFGNMGENYELAAIKSSGISLNRIMRPLVIIALIITISAFYFSNNVLPVANLKFLTLLRDVREQKPAVQIEEGVFYSEIEGYVIKVGKKDQDGITIHDILIYDHTANAGNSKVTMAPKGRMEMSADKRYLVFTLFDGFTYDENLGNQQKFNRGNHAMQRTKFSEDISRIDLKAFDFKKSDASVFRNGNEMMNLHQLSFSLDSLNNYQDTVKANFTKYIVNDYEFLNLYQKILKEPDTIKPKNTAASIDTSKKYYVDPVLNIVIQKPSIKHTKTNTHAVDSQKVNEILEVAVRLDTNRKFNDTIIKNFNTVDAGRIINSALVLARNASYQSDITNQSIIGQAKNIARYDIEMNRKFTLSFACLIFFFIGAPLGAIIRKGGLGTPLVMSIAFFVSYYILAIIGEKSAKELVMYPALGMWLSSIIFVPIGIFITYKATADAPLLDRESYLKIYNKFLKYIPLLNRWLKE